MPDGQGARSGTLGAKEKERVESKTEGGGASHLTICHGQCCPPNATGQNSHLDPAACLFHPIRGIDPEDREARRNNSCDFSGIHWSRTFAFCLRPGQETAGGGAPRRLWAASVSG